MESTAIATTQNQLDPKVYLAPAMSVKEGVARYKQFQELVANLLIPATITVDKYGNEKIDMTAADYGRLPGTKTNTLFQPGANKLAMFFGLSVQAFAIEQTEDWEKGFFHYKFKATVSYNGQVIRDCIRSCGTNEKKYKWIWVRRPQPSKEVMVEMKEIDAGKMQKVWEAGRSSYEWHEKLPNPDPWSLQFVVEAMARKRAIVAVVKEALAADGFFAAEIDLEDLRRDYIDSEDVAEPEATKSNSGKLKTPAAALSPEDADINGVLIDAFSAQKGEKNGKTFFDSVWAGKSLAERRTKAEEFGYKGAVTAPAPEKEPITPELISKMTEKKATARAAGIEEKAQQVVDEIVEAEAASDPGALLQADIEDLSAALVTDFEMKRREVEGLIRSVASHTVIEELSPGLLEKVKATLTQEIAQLRKTTK